MSNLDAVLARVPVCREDVFLSLSHAAWLTLEPWTIDNGLITPTLKLMRAVLGECFADRIRALYAGHGPAA